MEKIWTFIAWRLPRPLVKWCAVRLGVHATVGQWSSQEVPLLTFMDALQRWDYARAPMFEVTIEAEQAGARAFEALNGPALIEAMERLGDDPAPRRCRESCSHDNRGVKHDQA